MAAWKLRDVDLKKYPHFDPPISVKDAEALANDPDKVARHAFYPFMLYHQKWNKFAIKGKRGTNKERPIRFAARRDAYIFSRYRHELSERYEEELQRRGLTENVLAYRRIPDHVGKGGKCNIHFARDAFQKIQELGNCAATALDISGFFEHLDHERLKKLWCRLLGVSRLPPDHFQVFKAITRYSVVEKEDVYRRLGHYGVKGRTASGKPINGYLTPYREVPKRLCSASEFRDKIAGGGAEKSAITTNYKPYGIPQGAPISDLLANIYLLDFDERLAQRLKPLGGAYFRYSDDILIICPGGATDAMAMMAEVQSLITEFGEKLVIKDEKSAVVVFERDGEKLTFRHVHGAQGKNGLEYLGFRFDGERVFIRDSTLSGLCRKVVRAVRRETDACARRYPDKDEAQLALLINRERLIKKFGRVERFEEQEKGFRHWTFWTYARRAADVFGHMGKPILRQLRKHKAFVERKIALELPRAVVRRERRLAAKAVASPTAASVSS